MHVLLKNKIQLMAIPSARCWLSWLAKKPVSIHATLCLFLSPCSGPQIQPEIWRSTIHSQVRSGLSCSWN